MYTDFHCIRPSLSLERVLACRPAEHCQGVIRSYLLISTLEKGSGKILDGQDKSIQDTRPLDNRRGLSTHEPPLKGAGM